METPERYKKLFGEVALEMGFLSAEQLYQGLDEQKARKKQGLQDKRIGQVLLEKNYLTLEQINLVLDVVCPVQEN